MQIRVDRPMAGLHLGEGRVEVRLARFEQRPHLTRSHREARGEEHEPGAPACRRARQLVGQEIVLDDRRARHAERQQYDHGREAGAILPGVAVEEGGQVIGLGQRRQQLREDGTVVADVRAIGGEHRLGDGAGGELATEQPAPDEPGFERRKVNRQRQDLGRGFRRRRRTRGRKAVGDVGALRVRAQVADEPDAEAIDAGVVLRRQMAEMARAEKATPGDGTAVARGVPTDIAKVLGTREWQVPRARRFSRHRHRGPR